MHNPVRCIIYLARHSGPDFTLFGFIILVFDLFYFLCILYIKIILYLCICGFLLMMFLCLWLMLLLVVGWITATHFSGASPSSICANYSASKTVHPELYQTPVDTPV